MSTWISRNKLYCRLSSPEEICHGRRHKEMKYYVYKELFSELYTVCTGHKMWGLIISAFDRMKACLKRDIETIPACKPFHVSLVFRIQKAILLGSFLNVKRALELKCTVVTLSCRYLQFGELYVFIFEPIAIQIRLHPNYWK